VSYGDDPRDTKVHVVLSVVKSESRRIRQATIARIVNKGLLGDKMVELSVTDQSTPALDPANGMATEEPLDFSKYLAKFESIAQKTERVVEITPRRLGLAEREVRTPDRLQHDRDNLTIMFNDEVRWRNAESSRTETLRTQLMQAERVVEALAASLDWVRVDACARCAQGICSTHQPAAGVIAATARPDKEN